LKQKSERYFKEYLEKIPNEQLVQFYNDLEWTPFPVLVIKEYQDRFKPKNKKELLKKLKAHTKIAKEKSLELSLLAKDKGSQTAKEIQSKGKKFSKSFSEAKFISSEKNLKILEKLADLNKKGIITQKEFASKKKELLKRI